MADRVKIQIIDDVKQSKYFTIILDCTTDTSHKEKMTFIVGSVKFSKELLSIEEHS